MVGYRATLILFPWQNYLDYLEIQPSYRKTSYFTIKPKPVHYLIVCSRLRFSLLSSEQNAKKSPVFFLNYIMGENFQLDRSVVLGKGAYATVFSGKWHNNDVAIKRIQLHDIINREEKTMRDLNHQNVLKLLGVDEDDNFKLIMLRVYHTNCRVHY